MRKSDFSIHPVLLTGYASIIIQCILLREILAVFFGNELVLGILFSVWLLFCGMGSLIGNKIGIWKPFSYTSLFILSSVSGIFLIRYFPTLFDPGSVIPAIAITLLFISAEAPVSFLTGYAFGTFAKISKTKHRVYGQENLGALIGALIVFFLTLVESTNAAIYLMAVIPLPAIALFGEKSQKNRKLLSASIASVSILFLCILFLRVDSTSASWKYAGDVTDIQYTKEGEVTFMLFERDTTILLNNTVYKTTLNKPVIEQAVHVPAAQRIKNKKVLVIFDRGHYRELRKYPELMVDIIETIPTIALKQSIIIAPEQYAPNKKYDLIFLGTSMPENTATSRFYTLSFLNRLRNSMSDSAVLSFTLPFTESYMPKNERLLYHTLTNTLRSVFPYVLIFPGNGNRTFMASDKPLSIPDSISVNTNYLASYTIPSIFEEKIQQANVISKESPVNKNTRPIALYYSLKNWMTTYGFSAVSLLITLVIIIILLTYYLPHSLSVLSVSTSGLATGVYSIGLLLFYQATYGSLYSEVSLLLIALNIGFVIGARIRHILFSDLAIGLYCVISIFLLGTLQLPPKLLFLLCHAGIGIISAGQFVTRKDVTPGILNSADLSGGLFGMALAATVLIPLFGVIAVAVGIFAMKVVVEIIVVVKSKRKSMNREL